MILKTHENILTAYGTIWSGDGKYFVSVLSRLEKTHNDIEIRLHTGGGSVFDGNLIYNACNKSNKIKKIVVDGISASMGSIIMLSREKTEMVENGYVMIHAPSSGSYGNAKDHESSAKLLKMIEKNFVAKLMARTGKTKKEVSKWMDGTDYWFDAEECLELGLISKIIPARVDTVLPKVDPENMDKKEVFNMYASLLTYDLPTSKIQIFNSKSKMKQPLITALALVGVTAQSSDTAVVAAVQEHIQKIEKERDDAVKALDDSVSQQIKVVLDQHEKAGSFDKEQRATYEKIGKSSGMEALLTVLGTPKNQEAPNISGMIQNNSSEARADWDFEKWQKEDMKGLEAMAEKDPAKFQKLFNAKYN
ncbi:Clp protease ClpP [Tenacibaculum maritimum]|uniref:Clp protease ClpP n=1 Tax=Tenacibaculum maritimum TaxID=107401 RepID=UPI0012E5036F|nr:Clp protease ClpP [Tenacibaculum maritimum]CAA0158641.1 conserved hypothetical protein [Tenacibaculum maritimum]